MSLLEGSIYPEIYKPKLTIDTKPNPIHGPALWRTGCTRCSPPQASDSKTKSLMDVDLILRVGNHTQSPYDFLITCSVIDSSIRRIAPWSASVTTTVTSTRRIPSIVSSIIPSSPKAPSPTRAPAAASAASSHARKICSLGYYLHKR